MRRLRWWWFLLRYRVARLRGKAWATRGLLPEFIFAYRERRRAGDFIPIQGGGDYGYFADDPRPLPWEDPHV